MTESAQLYELQAADLHIENLVRQLDDVEARLRDDRELAEARRQFDRLQAGLKAIRPQYREAELQAGDLLSKAEEVEKRLYGGSVRNPRELQNLEDDLHQLRRNQAAAEDRQLELLAQLEEAQTAAADAEASLERMEAAWNDTQRHLGEERERLSGELAAAKGQRDRDAAAIDPRRLALYDRLRASRGGQPVARLERGACQGCRLVLPTGEISKMRQATGLVQCSSCGRILYME